VADEPEAPVMVTLDEAVEYCGLAPEDVGVRGLVERLRQAAEDAFSDVADREFVATTTMPEARAFNLNGRRTVPIGDLADGTKLTVSLYRADGSLVRELDAAKGDFYLSPRYPKKGRPYSAIALLDAAPDVPDGYLEVESSSWGWASVPQRARQAVLEQIRMWWERDVTQLSTTMLADQGRVEVPRALASSVEWCARSYRRKHVA
jgi:hypothetical protein